jgi:H+/gluconate symporter-like permease
MIALHCSIDGEGGMGDLAGVAAIVLALVTLIALAWRGHSVILLAPVLALAAVAGAQGGPLLASYTQIFMAAAGEFIVRFFPLFLLGAVFGRLMAASGSAAVLGGAILRALGPTRAIPALVMACAALTYGGVSLFVVAFAVWPIAAALFRAANLPARLIPATIALGAFTFTMTALPGTPSIQNAIPMPAFGTTAWAAPGLSVIAAAVMAGFGWAWLEWRARHLPPGPPPPADPAEATAGAGPAVWAAALPLGLVLGLNLVFAVWVLPGIEAGYLSEPAYGATDLAAVQGMWAIVGALALAILAAIGLNARRLAGGLREVLDRGARDALLPVFNTASLVGFGAVVASLAAFGVVRDWALTAGGGNPLVSVAVGAGVLAGITGSASGGLSIALGALGGEWRALAEAAGVAPDMMHRVAVVATGGLDTLPHNGAVITLLGICGMTHRQAYGDIFMVAVVGPLVALGVLIGLGSALGTF